MALIGGGAGLGFAATVRPVIPDWWIKAATVLPALGYFPALGSSRVTLDVFGQLLAMPGLARGVALSFWTGFAATALSLFFCFSVLAAAWDTRAFRLVSHAISPLLSAPHAAAAIGLALVIAPSGLLFRLTGFDRPADLSSRQVRCASSLVAGLGAK